MKVGQEIVNRNSTRKDTYEVDKDGYHIFADVYEDFNVFVRRVTITANNLIEDYGSIINITYPSENVAVIVYPLS